MYVCALMGSKADILAIRALKSRAEREQQGVFVVEGWKGVMELLATNLAVVRIYVRSGVIPPAGSFIPDAAVEVSSKDMERMSHMKTPPGILATAQIPNELPIPLGPEALAGAKVPTLLVCDGISDPGNLGTLIRTAEWFGLAGVVCDRRGVDPWNTKCLQAAMGSAFRMPIWITSVDEWLPTFKGPSCALDAGGEPLDQIPFQPAALIVGSESHGLSHAARKAATTVAAIPGVGLAESLNAGVAGSIAMFSLSQSLATP